MKKLFVIIFTLFSLSVLTQNNINKLEQFSGNYIIKVKGYSSGNEIEKYTLYKDGTAEWRYIEKPSYKIISLKKGRWNVEPNLIKITIKGNTGEISENYKLKNGKWEFGDRYLEKQDN